MKLHVSRGRRVNWIDITYITLICVGSNIAKVYPAYSWGYGAIGLHIFVQVHSAGRFGCRQDFLLPAIEKRHPRWQEHRGISLRGIRPLGAHAGCGWSYCKSKPHVCSCRSLDMVLWAQRVLIHHVQLIGGRARILKTVWHTTEDKNHVGPKYGTQESRLHRAYTKRFERPGNGVESRESTWQNFAI